MESCSLGDNLGGSFQTFNALVFPGGLSSHQALGLILVLARLAKLVLAGALGRILAVSGSEGTAGSSAALPGVIVAWADCCSALTNLPSHFLEHFLGLKKLEDHDLGFILL